MLTLIFWTLIVIVVGLAALWFSPKRGWAFGPGSTWCKITKLCWHEKPVDPKPIPAPVPEPIPTPEPPPVFDYPLPWAEASCLELLVWDLPRIKRFLTRLRDSGIKVSKFFTGQSWSETDVFNGVNYAPAIYPVVKIEESSHGRFPVYDWLKENQPFRDKVIAVRDAFNELGLIADVTLTDGCSTKTQEDYGHRRYCWRSAVQYAEKWGGPLTGGFSDDKFHPGDDVFKHIEKYGPRTIYYWFNRDAKFWVDLFGPQAFYTICNEYYGPADPKPKDKTPAEWDVICTEYAVKFHSAMTAILLSLGVPRGQIICNPLDGFDKVAALGTLMEFHGVSTAKKLAEVKGLHPVVPFSRMVYNGDGPDKYATGIAEYGNRTRESSVAQAGELRDAVEALDCQVIGTWLRSCEITGTPPKGGDLDETEKSVSMMKALAGHEK